MFVAGVLSHQQYKVGPEPRVITLLITISSSGPPCRLLPYMFWYLRLQVILRYAPPNLLNIDWFLVNDCGMMVDFYCLLLPQKLTWIPDMMVWKR